MEAANYSSFNMMERICPNCARKDDEIRRLHIQLKDQDHQAQDLLETLRQEKGSLERRYHELASKSRFYKDPRHEIRNPSESSLLSLSFPYSSRESGNSSTILTKEVGQ
jgi:hypothetical protein